MLKKKDKILYISTAILALLYIISFPVSCISKDKRETIKSALVNPKYKEEISVIELCNSNNCLTITKNENFWILTEQNNKNSIPASSEMVNNLINNLTKVRNMYKLSDKIDKNSSFGLTTSDKFTIRYHYRENYHELTFGNLDFAQTGRYLMTSGKTTIYEIDTSFDNYLSTSVQTWSEPFIISQEVLGKITEQDIQNFNSQKLLELRHGGICPEISNQFESENSNSKELHLELGNKNFIKLTITPLTEETYKVQTQYFKADSKYPFYTSNAKISSWTYNKINDITL